MVAGSSAQRIPSSRVVFLRAPTLRALREAISEATLRPEADAVSELREGLVSMDHELRLAKTRAAHWVEVARADKRSRPFAESLMEQFPLDSAQGRALMSLAEALLRTPDPARADQLIAERLAEVRAGRTPVGSGTAGHSARGGEPGNGVVGCSAALEEGVHDAAARPKDNFVLRAGFALLGGISRLLPNVGAELLGKLSVASVTKPVVAPVVRATLRRAMRMLGEAFIVGETIESALARGKSNPALALCSFDVLGEGARTEADAQRYFESYAAAIDALSHQPPGTVHERSSISVKLSALEPRYTLLQRVRVAQNLVPRMLELARKAAGAGIGMTIDAEEADRLDLSLDLIEAVARDEATLDWDGLGLAVQAYGRRAPLVIDWVAEIARVTGRRMTVRLVKGAYWDSEIKRAQERGLSSFPVYTSKAATDVSYLVCAQRLFAANDVIYPQFATHNALTVAAVLGMAPSAARYEFQRLHGMGELVFEAVRADIPNLPLVRAYAPVGTHEDLLPYLVRRLLENGANTSFVHQFLNPRVPVEQVVRDPISALNDTEQLSRVAERIREPQALYGPERRNSDGPDWGDPAELTALAVALEQRALQSNAGGPILNGRSVRDLHVPVQSPSNFLDIVGLSRDATAEEINNAMEAAAQAQLSWDALSAAERADCLNRAALLLEDRRVQFLNLLVREAGKTLPDAVAELREAVDFCRYYAARGRELFDEPQKLNGPTGERNLLSLHGRGVFVCISPWNFPLAIFTGQITAALMAGNSVVAKPAPATPLVAHAMTALLHEAGVPGDVLQLTPAEGPAFSDVVMKHPALAGVAFTGSTATAATINRALASRDGAIIPLIAETGGVNAMIVDATALPEQVVDDVIASAFTSAGQRCSALRVLYLQEEVAEEVIGMLTGAMQCLSVGDPGELSTDIGPVISAAALGRLRNHAARMRQESQLLYACPLDEKHRMGYYFAPHLFELRALDQLRTEEFGPILHVVRYKSDQLAQVIAAIRATGFGLTLGVHSRLESVADYVFRSVSVGNTYVNRNMIGAVVGVQPFGGQGLSGTGPKAGGPHYLLRFANERTLTINTVAVGGNVELLS
jgi:RHH-type transcriptional regulator, proline utilization regulon repressor / proline dehydrogenase / delta 1-pyrroline-5-carboxylate dehydrogenase